MDDEELAEAVSIFKNAAETMYSIAGRLERIDEVLAKRKCPDKVVTRNPEAEV